MKILLNYACFRTEGGASGNESSELAEYKRVHEYCSNRLDSLLDDLQNTICDLCEEETDHEDKLMVSLAGLKQVSVLFSNKIVDTRCPRLHPTRAKSFLGYRKR